jgi:hypothetical protein
VEPRKPADRQAILRANPRVTAADLDEYERLLSKRYARVPSAYKQLAAAPDPDEIRLKELTEKIFGKASSA